MLSITSNTIPKWSINNDINKVKFISNAVHKYLIPKYSRNKEWCNFFDYLSIHDDFAKSSHYYRYLNTFGKITELLGKIVNKTIIETGGACPITTYLASRNNCFVTEADLRTGFDIDSEFADIVISLEVIEHIKDVPEKELSEIVLFQETGIKSFASEMNRILKPGGDVILTTPNICSYKAISNAIEHKAPCVFRKHVREYTKDELLNLFSQLDLQYHSTMFNFFMLGDSFKQWDEIFLKLGWSTDNRGDDHFFYFIKPTSKH